MRKSHHHAVCPTRSPGCLARIRSRRREAGCLEHPHKSHELESKVSLERDFRSTYPNVGLTLRPDTVRRISMCRPADSSPISEPPSHTFVGLPNCAAIPICSVGSTGSVSEQHPPLGNATRFDLSDPPPEIAASSDGQRHFQFQRDFIRREDFPVQPHYLPRPLSPREDQLFRAGIASNR